MKAIFIRHAESTGNAGVPCHDHSLLELTEKGRAQASNMAASWTVKPSLIAVSPYLRTQQTAKPTIERFLDVPVETWETQEFTYLEPSRWNGTSRDSRLPHIAAYWKRADPDYCDGPGAESFGTLLRRGELVLSRLEQMSAESLVCIFTHCQFMQAVNMILRCPELSDAEKMAGFCRFNIENAIRNCAQIELTSEDMRNLNCMTTTKSWNRLYPTTRRRLSMNQIDRHRP